MARLGYTVACVFVFVLSALYAVYFSFAVFSGRLRADDLWPIAWLAAFVFYSVYMARRLWRRLFHGVPILPAGLFSAGGGRLWFGMSLIWLGNLIMVYTFALIAYLLITQMDGVPVGIGLGFGIFAYIPGFALVYFARRKWEKGLNT